MMKKKTLLVIATFLSVLGLTSLAHAANPGVYLGAGLGASSLNTPDKYLFNIANTNGSTSRKRGGLGGRVFVGYNFNKYFGVEGGIAQYARSIYKGTAGNQNSSIEYTAYAIDVVGKGYLPLGESGFNVYALGGLANLAETVKYNNGGVPLSGAVATPANGSKTYNKINPIVGAGVSYDINEHFTTNLEFSRIVSSGNFSSSRSATPNADLATLNLAYNFG